MNFYVYILRSDIDNSFYKGFSTHPAERLIQHNNGETQSTRNLVPWQLVYVEAFLTKREALIREKNLKKAERSRILALINSSKNIASQFISQV